MPSFGAYTRLSLTLGLAFLACLSFAEYVVEGEFQMVVEEQLASCNEYGLVSWDDGQRSVKLSQLTVDKYDLHSGDMVRLTITGSESDAHAVLHDIVDAVVVSRKAADKASTSGERTLLIVMISYNDATAVFDDCGLECVRDFMWRDTFNVDTVYRQASYNTLTIPESEGRIVSLHLDMDTSRHVDNSDDCDDDLSLIRSDVRSALSSQLGIDTDDFDMVAHYTKALCGIGVAFVGGSDSYMNSDHADTLAHELGHNFGLLHSGLDDDNDGEQNSEYGDTSSIMGFSHVSLRSFNMPSQLRADWIPDEFIFEMPSNPSCAPTLVTLQATHSLPTTAGHMLAITAPRTSSLTYSVSFRTGVGHDTLLASRYKDVVSVHYSTSSGRSSLVALLDVGDVFEDEDNEYRFEVVSVSGDLAVVRVQFCSGFVGCGSQVTGTTVGQPSNFGFSSGEIVNQILVSTRTRLTLSTCNSNFNTVVRLLDSSDNELAVCDDCAGSCGTQAVLDHTVTAGTYSILVEGSGSAEGSFVLDVGCEDLDSSTPSNSPSPTPSSLFTCGSRVTGSTVGASNQFGNSAGDAVFPFTLAVRTIMTFDACDSDYDIFLRVFDDSLTQVAGRDDGPCGLQTELTVTLDPGSYTFVVDGFSSREGDFVVDVSCEVLGTATSTPSTAGTPASTPSASTTPDSTPAGTGTPTQTATASRTSGGTPSNTPSPSPSFVFGCDSVVAGSTEGLGSVRFPFTLTLPTEMEFDACDSDFDTVLELYEVTSSGEDRIERCDDCGGCGFQSRMTTDTLAPGDYVLLLRGFDGEEGEYEIETECEVQSTTPTSSPSPSASTSFRPPVTHTIFSGDLDLANSPGFTSVDLSDVPNYGPSSFSFSACFTQAPNNNAYLYTNVLDSRGRSRCFEVIPYGSQNIVYLTHGGDDGSRSPKFTFLRAGELDFDDGNLHSMVIVINQDPTSSGSSPTADMYIDDQFIVSNELEGGDTARTCHEGFSGLGAKITGSGAFDGFLSSVVMYPDALSRTEITGVSQACLGVPTSTPTSSESAAQTPSSSETPAETPSATESAAQTPSATETAAQTPSGSETAAQTPSSTESAAQTPSATESAAQTPSASETAAQTPSSTDTPAQTPSATASTSASASPSPTAQSDGSFTFLSGTVDFTQQSAPQTLPVGSAFGPSSFSFSSCFSQQPGNDAYLFSNVLDPAGNLRCFEVIPFGSFNTVFLTHGQNDGSTSPNFTFLNTGAVEFDDGQLHALVVRVNQDGAVPTAELFLDGNSVVGPVSLSGGAFASTCTNGFSVAGAKVTGSLPFDGTVADIVMHPGLLDTSEIEALATACSGVTVQEHTFVEDVVDVSATNGVISVPIANVPVFGGSESFTFSACMSQSVGNDAYLFSNVLDAAGRFRCFEVIPFGSFNTVFLTHGQDDGSSRPNFTFLTPSSGTFQDNQMHSLVITIKQDDAGSTPVADLHLDGALVVQDQPLAGGRNAATCSQGLAVVGSKSTGVSRLDGSVAHVKMTAGVLSAADISAHAAQCQDVSDPEFTIIAESTAFNGNVDSVSMTNAPQFGPGSFSFATCFSQAADNDAYIFSNVLDALGAFRCFEVIPFGSLNTVFLTHGQDDGSTSPNFTFLNTGGLEFDDGQLHSMIITLNQDSAVPTANLYIDKVLVAEAVPLAGGSKARTCNNAAVLGGKITGASPFQGSIGPAVLRAGIMDDDAREDFHDTCE